MDFFLPEPDDFDIQRSDLSFGMRSSSRFYAELVVPGIGSALRVRHFTWSVVGIYLKENYFTSISSSDIANAIEALANRMDQKFYLNEGKERQIRGIRSFKRNSDVWDFKSLTKRQNYVLITHRQQTSRALPEGKGLGFTIKSSRFNSMKLSFAGTELANVFLKQKSIGTGNSLLETTLSNWIKNEFYPKGYVDIPKFREALSQFTPLYEERNIVIKRLNTTSTDPIDSNKRVRLIKFFEDKIKRRRKDPEIIEIIDWLKTESTQGIDHARDIETALAFEEMRNSGLNVIQKITEELGDKQEIEIRTLLNKTSVKDALNEIEIKSKKFLSSKGETHPTAKEFANLMLKNKEESLKSLISRDEKILCLDKKVVYPGALYSEGLNLYREDEIEQLNRPYRIYQFLNLWRDCNG